jgi:hypothetical protein
LFISRRDSPKTIIMELEIDRDLLSVLQQQQDTEKIYSSITNDLGEYGVVTDGTEQERKEYEDVQFREYLTLSTVQQHPVHHHHHHHHDHHDQESYNTPSAIEDSCLNTKQRFEEVENLDSSPQDEQGLKNPFLASLFEKNSMRQGFNSSDAAPSLRYNDEVANDATRFVFEKGDSLVGGCSAKSSNSSATSLSGGFVRKVKIQQWDVMYERLKQ